MGSERSFKQENGMIWFSSFIQAHKAVEWELKFETRYIWLQSSVLNYHTSKLHLGLISKCPFYFRSHMFILCVRVSVCVCVCVLLCLQQLFSTGDNSVLQETLDNAWRHFLLLQLEGGGAAGISWVEGRVAARHPTMHRPAPMTKSHTAQNVNTALQ